MTDDHYDKSMSLPWPRTHDIVVLFLLIALLHFDPFQLSTSEYSTVPHQTEDFLQRDLWSVGQLELQFWSPKCVDGVQRCAMLRPVVSPSLSRLTEASMQLLSGVVSLRYHFTLSLSAAFIVDVTGRILKERLRGDSWAGHYFSYSEWNHDTLLNERVWAPHGQNWKSFPYLELPQLSSGATNGTSRGWQTPGLHGRLCSVFRKNKTEKKLYRQPKHSIFT